MKQLMNFRFDPQVIASLEALAEHLHCSKTRIVEEAILRYAEKKQIQRSGLFSLAGSIPNDEADSMLEAIRNSKNRKEFPGNL
jgi:hypothetical protein